VFRCVLFGRTETATRQFDLTDSAKKGAERFMARKKSWVM
jgi:hypothetical protein